MSEQLFEVSGISLDNTISILYGVIPPGTAQDTNDAPQGSVYFDTSGITWKKIAAGTGTAAWSQAAGGGSVVSGINSVRNVTGNNTLDSLDATVVDTGVWAITTSSVAAPLNRQTVIITGSHNGATTKYSIYSKLDLGTKIAGITYDVRLLNNSFELVVFAPIFCNIDCYRLNAISNGSTVTLITSGGGSGTGDVTTAQLNAEILARQNADTILTTAVAGKADIAGLATQFTNINTQFTTVNTALTTEASARVAADLVLTNAIAAIPAGAKGDTGAQGIKGDTGAQGIQGETGLQGIQGEPGLPGATGSGSGDVTTAQLTAETSARVAADLVLTNAIAAIPAGAKGDTGAQGIQGDTGAQGIQGVQGLKGDTGDAGLQGVQGVQGVPGVKGDTGDQGAQGVQGVQGIQGIPGVDGSGGGGGGGSGVSIKKEFTKAGHGFSVGNVLTRISGVWVLGNAASDTTSEILGIVNAITTDTFELTMIGYISGLTGLTDSETYYLSDTVDGGYTSVSPSAVDTVSKPIFVAISATEAMVIQSRGILN